MELTPTVSALSYIVSKTHHRCIPDTSVSDPAGRSPRALRHRELVQTNSKHLPGLIEGHNR